MASGDQNRAVRMKHYIDDGPATPGSFVEYDVPEPAEGDVPEGGALVQIAYVSVDPYMRGRMRNQPGYFVGPFQLDSPIDGYGIVKVLSSRSPRLPAGGMAQGSFAWVKRQILSKEAAAMMRPLDTAAAPELPLTAYLGPLGMTGLTAYASLAKIGKPVKGETAYVSGAAGAVGYVVGQLLANVHGVRVVGSAGSDEKVAFLKRVGFHDAFNYKTTTPEEALPKLCPNGIDIYYDNVGGQTLEAALESMNTFGRVVACGAISQYDGAAHKHYGVKNLFHVVTKRLLVQGFIVGDLIKEYGESFEADMRRYLTEKKVTVEVDIRHGLEQAGTAFCDMMRGANAGKMLVAV